MLLCLIELYPLTEPKAVPMAEWNAYYRNDDEEEGQEEGDQPGGEMKASHLHHASEVVMQVACHAVWCQEVQF